MGKKTQTQTQTTKQGLDPASQEYVNRQRQAAQDAYDQFTRQFGGGYQGGTDPNITGALGDFGRYTQAGDLGLSALSGNTDALNMLMGPLDPYFNHASAAALRDANQAETLQGGGFGSRSGIAAGTALGNIRNAQLAQAYGNAGQLANLGMGANQNVAGLGQWLQQFGYNDYLNRQSVPGQGLGLLNMGLGPTGSVGTQTQQTQSDPWAQILGAGLSIGSMFLPGAGPAAMAARGAGGAAGAGLMNRGSIPMPQMPYSGGYNPRQYGLGY